MSTPAHDGDATAIPRTRGETDRKAYLNGKSLLRTLERLYIADREQRGLGAERRPQNVWGEPRESRPDYHEFLQRLRNGDLGYTLRYVEDADGFRYETAPLIERASA